MIFLFCLLSILFLFTFHIDAIHYYLSVLSIDLNEETILEGIKILKIFFFGLFFYFLFFKHVSPAKKKLNLFLLVLIILLYLIHCLYFFPFTVDDAFISFQYAKNLTEGHGMTFNQGEKVEGYTNFLLVIIEALILRLGLDLIFWIKSLSIIAGGLIIFLTYRFIILEIEDESPIHLLPCLIIAMNSPFVLASTIGLETQVFTLAVFSGIYLFLKYESPKISMVASALLTLAILIRPEGLIFFVFITLSKILFDRKSGKQTDFLLWMLPFLLIFFPYFGWRYVYFGELLPNTFHAKVGGDLLSRMIEGKKYIRQFMKTFGLHILILVPLVEFFRKKLTRSGKVLLVLILTYFLYIGYTGKDWIPQFRFLAPLIPLIFILVHNSTYSLFKVLNPNITWKTKIILKIILLIPLTIFISNTISLKNTSNIYRHTMMRAAGYENAHKKLALWFKENSPEDAAIALMDVGIVKFFSDRYVIDITGLTDKFISRSKGGLLDKAYDLSYLFQKNPDYIVLVTLKNLDIHPFESLRRIDTRIYNHPRFKENYQYLFNFNHFYKSKNKDKGYYLNTFKMKE